MSGLTTEQIAARQWKPAWYVEEVLRDEAKRGHVEEIDGHWRATPTLVETYAGAFSFLGGPRVRNTERGRST
jgi:hypothetical protein